MARTAVRVGRKGDGKGIRAPGGTGASEKGRGARRRWRVVAGRITRIWTSVGVKMVIYFFLAKYVVQRVHESGAQCKKSVELAENRNSLVG